MQRSNATCIRAHHVTSGCSHTGRRMFVQVETRSGAPFLKSILRAMFPACADTCQTLAYTTATLKLCIAHAMFSQQLCS